MQRVHDQCVDSEIYHSKVTAACEHIFLTILCIRYLRTATPLAETAVCVISRAVDSLYLVCRPCRSRTGCCRFAGVHVRRYPYGFGVLRFLVHYIYCVDQEIVCGVRIETRYRNLAVCRSEISIKALRQIYYTVLSHLVIIRSRYSDHCAVVVLANQRSADHHRFLGICCRNPCRTIYAELKDLHSPPGSGFRAPEADITHFSIIVELSHLIRTAIYTLITYEIVTQRPVGVVLREIQMIILRTCAFKMNIYFIYIIQTAEIHYEPSVKSTRSLIAGSTVSRASLPLGSGIAVQHAVDIVIAFRSSYNRQTLDLGVSLRCLAQIVHLELVETLSPLRSTLDALILDVLSRDCRLQVNLLPTGMIQIALGVNGAERLTVSRSQQLELLGISAFPVDLEIVERAALTHVEQEPLGIRLRTLPTGALIAINGCAGITARSGCTRSLRSQRKVDILCKTHDTGA